MSDIIAERLQKQALNFEKRQFLAENNYDAEFIDLIDGKDIYDFKINVMKARSILNKKIDQMASEKIKAVQYGTGSEEGKQTHDENIFSVEEMKKMGVNEIQKNYDKFMSSLKYHRENR